MISVSCWSIRICVCLASEEELQVDYSGMLSSPSGYSSNEEDDAPYANAEMLETVRMEVCKMHANEIEQHSKQDSKPYSAICLSCLTLVL